MLSESSLVDASVGKKRQREPEVDGSKRYEKIRVVDEDLNKMGIASLREVAVLMGVSSSGSKRDLIHRLSAESRMDSNNVALEDLLPRKKDDEKEKEKQVISGRKGTAVLDQYLADHIKTEYHVLQHDDNIYDATLNQTNVGDNNNKFYVIQALESNGGGKFLVYTRWGRVGIKGQDKLQGPYASRDIAIKEFETKFFAKTKNHWADRKEFIFHPKCYMWLEMDYDGSKESGAEERSTLTVESQLRLTKLDPRIANFMALICDIDMMKQRMLELGLNTEKLPLGKLSRSTILKGYDVLRRISEIIGKSEKEKLEQLSGEFYTIIPHNLGFRKMRDFCIDTHYKLKGKLEMVEALGEIEVATSLINDDMYSQEDPLYSHYKCLRCDLIPLEVGSKDFSMIDKYIQNTGDKRFIIDIVQIFRASREGETERFKKFSNTKNRMLLWHGSHLANWTGILSQGLRIAPPEAPTAGYTFGKGVYFSDMFAKSQAYSYAGAHPNAVLVLCEVALGDMNELRTFNHSADKLPEGNLSAKAIGSIAPDPSEAEVLEEGVIVPMGKPLQQAESRVVCGRNEYVIFNVDQIRIRYVVQVKIHYNYKGEGTMEKDKKTQRTADNNFVLKWGAKKRLRFVKKDQNLANKSKPAETLPKKRLTSRVIMSEKESSFLHVTDANEEDEEENGNRGNVTSC